MQFKIIIDGSKENSAPLFDSKYHHNFNTVIRTENLLQRARALEFRICFEIENVV